MEGRDKVLTWRKWHAVDDGGLQVALETTLPAGAEPEYAGGLDFPPDEDLEECDMIYRAKAVLSRIGGVPDSKETVDRHYHPRIGPVADLRKPVRKVAFKVHIKNGLFKRIALRRHADHGERPAEMWCGRASEKEAFGFNTQGSKNQFFVTLAYPGLKQEFEPLFIKVAEYGEVPYFLKVEAHDEADGVVVVEVSLISILRAPAFLRVYKGEKREKGGENHDKESCKER